MAGDPARAKMFAALAGGRALTSTKLTRTAANLSQTASGHLARPTEGGLFAMMRQGRLLPGDTRFHDLGRWFRTVRSGHKNPIMDVVR